MEYPEDFTLYILPQANNNNVKYNLKKERYFKLGDFALMGDHGYSGMQP